MAFLIGGAELAVFPNFHNISVILFSLYPGNFAVHWTLGLHHGAKGFD